MLDQKKKGNFTSKLRILSPTEVKQAPGSTELKLMGARS